MRYVIIVCKLKALGMHSNNNQINVYIYQDV